MSEAAIETIAVDPGIPEAVELIDALSEELARRYNHVDDGSGNFKPEDALAARSAFVIGRAGSRAVACGGFRPLQGNVAEIKRMFVVPDCRAVAIRKRFWQSWSDSPRRAVTQPSAWKPATDNRRQFGSMSGQGITASRTLAFMWAAKGVCVSRSNSRTRIIAPKPDASSYVIALFRVRAAAGGYGKPYPYHATGLPAGGHFFRAWSRKKHVLLNPRFFPRREDFAMGIACCSSLVTFQDCTLDNADDAEPQSRKPVACYTGRGCVGSLAAG